MLAKFKDIYFTPFAMSVAQGHCMLRTASPNAAHLAGFEPIRMGNRTLWQKTVDNLDNVIFYPELKYKKYRLQVLGWPEDSQGDTVLAEIYGGWEELPYEVDHTSLSFERAKLELEADGWKFIDREGFRKVIPINMIEKKEGSPR